MKRTLRIGLLGCSSIARRRTVPALGAIEDATVTAVAARSPDRAKEFAQEYGANAREYDELVTDDGVDAVYVSTPNANHHEWTKKALLAGKHVLCEKPLTTTAEASRELVDLAASRGLVLRENFTFLHHPQHARVRQLLDEGRLGSLRTFAAAFCIPPLPGRDIRYRPELGGGSLLDAGVYPIRAAQLMLGPGLSLAGATLRVDETRGVDVGGHVLLVSPGGAFATLDFGFQHGYRSRYSLFGSSGALSVDRVFTPPPSRQQVLRIEEQNHVEEIELPPADQFLLAVRSFTTAALAGRDPSEAAEEGASCIETARLVDEALATAVRVPDHEAVQY